MSHATHIYGPAATRFWAKVDRRGDGECWTWLAAKLPDGYGRFKDDTGRVVYAHRFAYEARFGAIPDGLQIDHVAARGCTSKSCVNPAHLDVVTSGENTRRWSATITHCPSGHAYAEHGAFYGRSRRCRRCHADRERVARAEGRR